LAKPRDFKGNLCEGFFKEKLTPLKKAEFYVESACPCEEKKQEIADYCPFNARMFAIVYCKMQEQGCQYKN
jgi:hypothetical protein